MSKRILFLLWLSALVLVGGKCCLRPLIGEEMERRAQVAREKARVQLAAIQNIERLGGRTHTIHSDVFLDGTRKEDSITIKVSFRRPIGDDVLEHLVAFDKLQSLTLRPERITSKGWKSLAPLAKLRELEISYANDNCLEGIEALASLEHLTIRISTITEKGLAHLIKLPALRRLEINHAPLDDGAVKPLMKFGHLALLRLQDTDIADNMESELRAALPNTAIIFLAKDRKPPRFDDID